MAAVVVVSVVVVVMLTFRKAWIDFLEATRILQVSWTRDLDLSREAKRDRANKSAPVHTGSGPSLHWGRERPLLSLISTGL